MAVQDAKNGIFSTNPQTSGYQNIAGYGWQMVKDDHDGKGPYFFINGGSQKKYLSEVQAEQEYKKNQAKKDKVQQDITNFFTGQIQDFNDWEKYYASKVSELQGEIAQQKASIKENTAIAETNLGKLNPLYQKYGTTDVKSFSDGTDKRNGTTWTGLLNKAKHSVTISEGLISIKQMFLDAYIQLMNHTAACGNAVEQIAQNCLDQNSRLLRN